MTRALPLLLLVQSAALAGALADSPDLTKADVRRRSDRRGLAGVLAEPGHPLLTEGRGDDEEQHRPFAAADLFHPASIGWINNNRSQWGFLNIRVIKSLIPAGIHLMRSTVIEFGYDLPIN
jgi:hypothetical protein